MNPTSNPHTITTTEWWTLAIGLAIIIIIFALLFFTGSNEPSTSAVSSSATGSSTLSSIVTSDATSQSDASSQSSSATVAEAGDTVTLNYTGTLADGTVFDSSASHGQPFSFVLGAGQVIPGWDKGIVGMTVGESKTLVIAPADAYGAQGVKNPSTGAYIIPPNATLTFKVQLVSVQPPTSK